MVKLSRSDSAFLFKAKEIFLKRGCSLYFFLDFVFPLQSYYIGIHAHCRATEKCTREMFAR